MERKKEMSGWKYAKNMRSKLCKCAAWRCIGQKWLVGNNFFLFLKVLFKSLRCSYRINRRKKRIKILFLKVFFSNLRNSTKTRQTGGFPTFGDGSGKFPRRNSRSCRARKTVWQNRLREVQDIFNI